MGFARRPYFLFAAALLLLAVLLTLFLSRLSLPASLAALLLIGVILLTGGFVLVLFALVLSSLLTALFLLAALLIAARFRLLTTVSGRNTVRRRLLARPWRNNQIVSVWRLRGGVRLRRAVVASLDPIINHVAGLQTVSIWHE